MKTQLIWLKPGQHQIETRLATKEEQTILVLGWFQNQDQTQVELTIRHQAAQSHSQILIRVGGQDQARIKVQTRIIIEPQAQEAQAELQSKTLLLDQAQAQVQPELEIKTNQVRASHAASIGSLDPNQLFYLQQRGLKPQQARRQLIRAFFHQGTWFKNQSIQKQLTNYLSSL